MRHHGLDDDDDDAQNETGNGGLQLVYKCLTDRVWEEASILWTCYTERLLHVKSASDQVAYSGAHGARLDEVC